MSNISGTEYSIQRIHDFEMSPLQKEKLKILLQSCFLSYFSNRIYHKQIPTFRLLCQEGDKIISHLGIIHRAVSIEGEPIEIFGLLDLCTVLSYQGRGFASAMIQEALDMASKHQVKHLFLFTDEEQKFYEKFGFQSVSATCRWLAIEELESHSLLEKDVSDILMVRTQNPSLFNAQKIDLLGELF